VFKRGKKICLASQTHLGFYLNWHPVEPGNDPSRDRAETGEGDAPCSGHVVNQAAMQLLFSINYISECSNSFSLGRQMKRFFLIKSNRF
jgi:hypothetical protein